MLRRTFKRRLAAAADVEAARAVMEMGKPIAPKDVRFARANLGGVDCEVVEGVESVAGTLLYLHGGGYFACSPVTHRPVTTALARAGWRVIVPDYRRAPEHPFPAAAEDAAAVYAALVQDGPVPVAGDSAGGGLALGVAQIARQRGLPAPAALVLFSPLTDLTVSGPSVEENARRCAMFTPAGLRRTEEIYLAGGDPADPLASPLFADPTGWPRMLIQVGADESLLDDSLRLAARARAAGVPVTLSVWRAVPHVWQLFGAVLPEGRRALAEASAFLAGQEVA